MRWALAAAVLLARTALPASTEPPPPRPELDAVNATMFYSPLTRIDQHNVRSLGFAWQFKTGTYRGLEATPVIEGGVLYTSGSWGTVYALEAATGKLRWRFELPTDTQSARFASVDVVNRGVAVGRGRVYVTGIDCRTYALDALTGKTIWDVATADDPTYTCSGAPLIAGNVLIVGNAGSDTGAGGLRGYVSAYDLESGTLRWRFYTVPKLGESSPSRELVAAAATWDPARNPAYGGGGNVWDGMAYDPELDRVFLGTGNSAPYASPRTRKGRAFDRLYTASIVAVDASSGRMAWHYQTTPGDIWDLDASAKMVLADVVIDGRPRKTLMQANKNGYFYVIDRLSGKPISARAFAYMNWSTGMDAHFRPVVSPDADYLRSARLIYPGAQGAHGWAPMSYSPITGLVYIPTLDMPNIIVDLAGNPGARVRFVDGGTGPGFVVPDEHYDPNADSLFGRLPPIPATRPDGARRLRASIKAWDPVRQRLVWEQQTSQDHFVLDGGVLSTGGGVVFAGREDGLFVAYAASDGRILKSIDTGTATLAAPVTYEIDGTQYVAVMQGHGGSLMYSFAGTAALRHVNEGRILVFKLGGADVPQPASRFEEPYRRPPPRNAPASQVAAGRVLFTTWCSKCHSLGSPAVTPDLSRLGRGIDAIDTFKAVVLKGALQPQGMARFDDVLTASDAESIHAYLVDESWRAFESQERRTAP